ncbi:Myophilin [Clonorchis sinensis]|uniref:Myophilin n=2 Tax=Clonorchis sinensis TaxID=79923 RepID=A0A8T1MXR2_CLOSI|nr:Myophilin [Clonorchis sinensis]GAA31374.1 calponin-3 [Clonorchis sinensis]
MANRMMDMGMDVQVNRRLNSKYDAASEQEAIGWVNKLTGDNVPLGRENVCASLKNGQTLIKLINIVYEGTTQLPPEAARQKRPFKANTMSAPFKQMENIQMFLNAAAAYGVPRTSLFQTVDLYEARNMAQVLNTLLQLGTECQRNNFNGETCGPKPTYENKREFTEEQLRASEGIIGLQAGTNKLASQAGMSHGGPRHIADIKVEAASKEGQSVLGLQMGSNKGASQAGMSHGGPRHIADIKVDQASKEGQAVLGLQMGSNKGASQAGMSHGGPRHIADIKVDAASKEGQNVIGLQMGSNKFASQAGMSHGGQRHIADIKVGEMSKEGSGVLGMQMGPTKDQVASQSGMSFGAQRHIIDSH